MKIDSRSDILSSLLISVNAAEWLFDGKTIFHSSKIKSGSLNKVEDYRHFVVFPKNSLLLRGTSVVRE